MNKMKTILPLSLILGLFLLNGCASSSPRDEQVATALGLLAQQRTTVTAETHPALDLTGDPLIHVNKIDGDDIGLSEALCNCFKEAGLQVTEDPSQANIFLSGQFRYLGDPEEKPSQLHDLERTAQVAGATSTGAMVAMGAANPLSLVGSGVGLLSSAITDSLQPDRLEGVVELHVRQGSKLWDINLDQTVEESAEVAPKKLSESLAHDALGHLGG